MSLPAEFGEIVDVFGSWGGASIHALLGSLARQGEAWSKLLEDAVPRIPVNLAQEIVEE